MTIFTETTLRPSILTYNKAGQNSSAAANALGISRGAMQNRIHQARNFPKLLALLKLGKKDAQKQVVSTREAAARLHRRVAGQQTAEDKLRDENVHLRAALSSANAVIKQHDQRDRVEDRLVEAVQGALVSNPYRQQFKRPTLKGRTKAAPHEMLSVVSDAHYPEVVEPAAALGLSYNADVCQRRMQYLRDKLIRYIDLRRYAYPIQKMTLAVNGDMLSGDIHEELEVTNEFPMSESLVKMAYMLYEMGRNIAEEVPAVEMIVLPGNHPRKTKKPRAKQKWNNWEVVMGEFVKALAGKDFTVTVPRDLVYRHKIFDFNVGITHGDGAKAASFAGIPWYAMKQRQDGIQALLKELGQKGLDLLVYAHFHQLIWQKGQGCSLFINGSIKGGDEYSIDSRYSAQSPVQGLLTFHPAHKVTDVSMIDLGQIR